MPRRRKPEYVPLGLLKQLASVQDTSLHLPSAFPLAHGATSQLSLRPTAKATAQRGDQPCCLSMIAKGRTNAQLAMHRDVRHKQGRLRDTKGTGEFVIGRQGRERRGRLELTTRNPPPLPLSSVMQSGRSVATLPPTRCTARRVART